MMGGCPWPCAGSVRAGVFRCSKCLHFYEGKGFSMTMARAIDHVSIIGAGAMGAIYGSILYAMDERCVSFIASKERYERLRTEGLIVNDVACPMPVVAPDTSCLPPAGLVIVAVKQHQLEGAIREMKRRVGPETTILSVMNGIDSERMLAAAFGEKKVLYAIAVGMDAVRNGNRINFKQQGRLLFGEATNPSVSARVRRVQELFTRAGINFETPPDMIRNLWWKFMINVGINQASAVLRAPYGVFQTSPEARELMEAAMWEVIVLADKEKVSLSRADIDAWMVVLNALNPAGKTSMLQDVEAGRKTEVETFSGKVIELGRLYGVPTPVNARLFDAIREIERNFPVS